MQNEFVGLWRQVSCIDLSEARNDEHNSSVLVEFSESKFVVTGEDDSVLIKGNYSLNSQFDPKRVDWFDTFGEDAGKTFLAIYKFENDELIFCAADDHMPRPENFEPRKGHVIRFFKRF